MMNTAPVQNRAMVDSNCPSARLVIIPPMRNMLLTTALIAVTPTMGIQNQQCLRAGLIVFFFNQFQGDLLFGVGRRCGCPEAVWLSWDSLLIRAQFDFEQRYL